MRLVVSSILYTEDRVVPQLSNIWYFQVFNRDEPEREKLVHVTVKAGDQGKPPLEDVCTIAVKIRDINDNPPIFDRANYDVPVAQVSFLTEVIKNELFWRETYFLLCWLIKDFPMKICLISNLSVR